jgi:hypothetical protein
MFRLWRVFCERRDYQRRFNRLSQVPHRSFQLICFTGRAFTVCGGTIRHVELHARNERRQAVVSLPSLQAQDPQYMENDDPPREAA